MLARRAILPAQRAGDRCTSLFEILLCAPRHISLRDARFPETTPTAWSRNGAT
ncbi:hypothetical protein A2U01_0087998, partial [Trifolium medium]|nr:hypothetical protein [Trifolium medium]